MVSSTATSAIDECEPENFEPRTILEIADCERTIQLDFDVHSEARRANSLHKLDTLIAALRVFRRASRRSSPSTNGASGSSRS